MFRLYVLMTGRGQSVCAVTMGGRGPVAGVTTVTAWESDVSCMCRPTLTGTRGRADKLTPPYF